MQLYQRKFRAVLNRMCCCGILVEYLWWIVIVTSCHHRHVMDCHCDIVVEVNDVTLPGKIAHKQTRLRLLIDIGTVNRPYKQIYVENKLHIRSQYPRKPQNRQLSHYRQIQVQSGSVTSDNLRKVRMQRQRPDVVIFLSKSRNKGSIQVNTNYRVFHNYRYKSFSPFPHTWRQFFWQNSAPSERGLNFPTGHWHCRCLVGSYRVSQRKCLFKSGRSMRSSRKSGSETMS